jgi:hypothetical protein
MKPKLKMVEPIRPSGAPTVLLDRPGAFGDGG